MEKSMLCRMGMHRYTKTMHRPITGDEARRVFGKWYWAARAFLRVSTTRESMKCVRCGGGHHELR